MLNRTGELQVIYYTRKHPLAIQESREYIDRKSLNCVTKLYLIRNFLSFSYFCLLLRWLSDFAKLNKRLLESLSNLHTDANRNESKSLMEFSGSPV